MTNFDNLSSFWTRFFKTEIPIYWKKIRNFFATLATLATSLLLLSTQAPGFALPPIVNTVCVWVIVIGFVIAFFAQQTVKPDTIYKQP